MSNSVRPHRQQLTRLLCPWDSPGKNTGVGCHFLLQIRRRYFDLINIHNKLLKWGPTLGKQASGAQDEHVRSSSPDINQSKIPLPKKPSLRSPWGNVLNTSQTPFWVQITHYTYSTRWNLEKVLQCNQASKLKWILQTVLRLTTFPNHFWHISLVSSIHFASSRWFKRLYECVYFYSNITFTEKALM